MSQGYFRYMFEREKRTSELDKNIIQMLVGFLTEEEYKINEKFAIAVIGYFYNKKYKSLEDFLKDISADFEKVEIRKVSNDIFLIYFRHKTISNIKFKFYFDIENFKFTDMDYSFESYLNVKICPNCGSTIKEYDYSKKSNRGTCNFCGQDFLIIEKQRYDIIRE